MASVTTIGVPTQRRNGHRSETNVTELDGTELSSAELPGIELNGTALNGTALNGTERAAPRSPAYNYAFTELVEPD